MDVKMYSKFGRQSNSYFLILGQKKQILSNKPRTRRTTEHTYSQEKRFLSPESLRKLVESTSKSSKNRLHKKPKQMSSFLCQSREQFYQANGIKSQGPSVEIYVCQSASKVGKAADFSLRPKTASRKKKAKVKESLLDPEKPKCHIRSPISFDKQIPRSNNHAAIHDLSYNPQLVSQKRCSTPEFSKYTNRRDNFPPRSSTPSYDAKFKLVNHRDDIVPNFKKIQAREPLLLKHLCYSKKYIPNYKWTDKRVSTPNFSKGAKRPGSPLPKHMQDVNTRIGLNTLSQKMLVMNSSFFITNLSVTPELNK